jgi:signal transduction histidine kinase
MSGFRRSVAGKLMLLFFLVGMLSLSIVGIYSYYKAKNAILKRTLEQLTSIRVMKKAQVELFFRERFKALELVAGVEELRGSEAVDSVRALYGAVMVVKSLPVAGQDCALSSRLTMLYNEVGKTGKPMAGDFFLCHAADTGPAGVIATPLKDRSGRFIGIVAMEISGALLDGIMLEKSTENGLGSSGEAYLVGRDRLMRTGSRFIPNSVMRTRVNTVSVNNAFADRTGSAIIDDYRTIPVLSSYSRLDIPGLDWVIIAEIDYKEAMIPIVGIRNDLVLISVIISVLIFSLAQVISRMITQPLVKLKKATSSIGEGRFDIRVEVTTSDEIGILGRTFNEMAVQLEAERNRRMTGIYDGQELERQRVARELHDGLGQMMVALKMKFENCIEGPAADREKNLSALRSDFGAIIGEVRKVSYDLAPTGISEFGLDSAMKLLCSEIATHSGINTEFNSFGRFEALPAKTRNYLFRIAQEALNNSVRHSGASNIYVHLTESAENIVLMVEDDGNGFESPGSAGNGMQNMRERARLLGGTFGTESSIGKGTTIRVKVHKTIKSQN